MVKESSMWDVFGTGDFGVPSRPAGNLTQTLPLSLPPADPGPLGWQELALCSQTDPEAFFPEKGGSTREAKRICESCEVRAECLEYALANDERFGIWGGYSERERRRLKQRRALGA
jgi:WhiB family redox-sensing transcriptional regulator